MITSKFNEIGAIFLLFALILGGCQPVPDAGEEEAQQSNVTKEVHEIGDENSGKSGDSDEMGSGVNLTSEEPFTFSDFRPGTDFGVGDGAEAVRKALGEPCLKREVSKSHPVVVDQVDEVDAVQEWLYKQDCSQETTLTDRKYISVKFIKPWDIVHSITVYGTVNGQGLDMATIPRAGKIKGMKFETLRAKADLPPPTKSQSLPQYNWSNEFYNHQIYLKHGRVGGITSIVVDSHTRKVIALKTEAYSGPEEIYNLIKAAKGVDLRYSDVQ